MRGGDGPRSAEAAGVEDAHAHACRALAVVRRADGLLGKLVRLVAPRLLGTSTSAVVGLREGELEELHHGSGLAGGRNRSRCRG